MRYRVAVNIQVAAACIYEMSRWLWQQMLEQAVFHLYDLSRIHARTSEQDGN